MLPIQKRRECGSSSRSKIEEQPLLHALNLIQIQISFRVNGVLTAQKELVTVRLAYKKLRLRGEFSENRIKALMARHKAATKHYRWLTERIVAIPPYTDEVRNFYATKLAKIALFGLETSKEQIERTLAIEEARQCRAVLGSKFIDDNKDSSTI